MILASTFFVLHMKQANEQEADLVELRAHDQ